MKRPLETVGSQPLGITSVCRGQFNLVETGTFCCFIYLGDLEFRPHEQLDRELHGDEDGLLFSRITCPEPYQPCPSFVTLKDVDRSISVLRPFLSIYLNAVLTFGK